MLLESLCSWFGTLIPNRYTATKCRHRTKQTGYVSAFGRTIITEMPLNNVGSVDYCLKCLEKMAIQCAWCRNTIFIGDPVTLYIPKKDFKIPEHATVHIDSKGPLQLVGCLAQYCADTGADQAGFWLVGENAKGHVHLL